jgi:hypothetical protein
MPNLPKSLPAKWKLNELLLPAKQYTYFEQWKQNPFEAGSKVHSAVNAWWMAECALLAYDEKSVVENTLQDVETFTKEGQLNLQWLDKGSTQGFILEADKYVLLAVRGTEFYSLSDIIKDPMKMLGVGKDLLADAQFTLESLRGPVDADIRAAKGFLNEFNKIRPEVDKFIDSIDKPVWLTGHSLGAAIVTLAAFYYGEEKIAGLYTYGSPRVGNQNFADEFDRRRLKAISFRYVNGDDLVAKGLPGFQHVGIEKTLPSKRNFLSRIFPLNMTDHAPIYYALKCWNLLVQ